MNKKAEGLSINIIIVAAIALIVLVVVVAIFTGRMGNWGGSIDEQTSKECTIGSVGGTMVNSADCKTEDIIFGAFDNSESGKVCCKDQTRAERVVVSSTGETYED